MGLSYHFSFHAPPGTTSRQLEVFLCSVETQAKLLGFQPTLIISSAFDNQERKGLARRLTTGLFVENETLKGVVLPRQSQVFSHDPVHGSCRLAPEQGVVLVITDRGLETVLGFLKYPKDLLDLNGRVILKNVTEGGWSFRDSLKTGDPRLRTLVKMFADAGHLQAASDDFAHKTL